jgi:hypothetical protein
LAFPNDGALSTPNKKTPTVSKHHSVSKHPSV